MLRMSCPVRLSLVGMVVWVNWHVSLIGVYNSFPFLFRRATILSTDRLVVRNQVLYAKLSPP
ncbi:hypothetical protein BJX99DRAFT_218408 [Aspergillus californicus]